MPDDNDDFRSMMQRAGVLLADDPPPPTASEQMCADSLSLTVAELRFARRLDVGAERYAASKSIRSLASFEAAQCSRGTAAQKARAPIRLRPA